MTRNQRFELEMQAAREEWARMWQVLKLPAIIFGLLCLIAALNSCAYVDPYLAVAQAAKNDAKQHLAQTNDAYAIDVADLAKTIPSGALARMPAGERKCALSALIGLKLTECMVVLQGSTLVTVPAAPVAGTAQ